MQQMTSVHSYVALYPWDHWEQRSSAHTDAVPSPGGQSLRTSDERMPVQPGTGAFQASLT